MSIATYEVCIDWNNDADFSDSLENITADVKELRWQRGRDKRLGSATASTLEITIHPDKVGKYSPENAAGDLFPYLLPGRIVRLRGTFGATYNLWYGYLSKVSLHPHWDDLTVYLYCSDRIDGLVQTVSNVEIVPACFAPDTIVYTPQGNVQIRQLRLGHNIYSWNFEKNIIELDKVSEVLKASRTLYRIICGKKHIDCSDNQPFWANGMWKLASELNDDDRIQTAQGFETVTHAGNLGHTGIVRDVHAEKNQNIFVGDLQLLAKDNK